MIKNDFNRISEAAKSLGGRAALSIPAPKMTVNMQVRMNWEAESDGWVRRCSGEMDAQKCRQQLRQNGHFWRKVWTWHTKQWDTVTSLSDLFTSFANWTLRPQNLYLFTAVSQIMSFGAICLVMACLELSNLKHIWTDECCMARNGYTLHFVLYIWIEIKHLSTPVCVCVFCI